jgi:hypothetical protein
VTASRLKDRIQFSTWTRESSLQPEANYHPIHHTCLVGTVVWVLQLTDGTGHHIRKTGTDKECVQSCDFLRWCADMLTAAQQAGVVKTHISVLVCGTPNGADSSLCCVPPNFNIA